MFSVQFLLVCEGWIPRNITVSSLAMTLAYVSVVRMIKQRTGIGDLDFLPLGNNEYIIWGQGRCQGYMSIKEAGQETSAQDLGGGL